MDQHQHAMVKCNNCGNATEINCFPDFKSEKDFYLNFKPKCNCGSDEWEIKELVEVVIPLSKDQKNIFSMKWLELKEVEKNE